MDDRKSASPKLEWLSQEAGEPRLSLDREIRDGGKLADASPLDGLFGGRDPAAIYLDLKELQMLKSANREAYAEALRANGLENFHDQVAALSNADPIRSSSDALVVHLLLKTPVSSVTTRFIRELDQCLRMNDFRSWSSGFEHRSLYEGDNWGWIDCTKFVRLIGGEYLLDCRLARGVIFPKEEFWAYARDNWSTLQKRDDDIARLSVSCGIEPSLRAEFAARVAGVIEEFAGQTSKHLEKVLPTAEEGASVLNIPEEPAERYGGKAKSGDIEAFLAKAYPSRSDAEPLTLPYLRQHDPAAYRALFNEARSGRPIKLSLPKRDEVNDALLAKHLVDLTRAEGRETARRLAGVIAGRLKIGRDR